MITPIIVVTGASKGIGAAISLHLGKLGAKVVMLARDMEGLKNIAEKIKKLNPVGIGIPYQVDLTNTKEMTEIAAKIIRDIGVPDVLINNAGAGKWTTLQETTVEEIVANIQVPGISTMVMTKLFLQSMLEKSKTSPVHIINITSPAGLGMYVPGTSGGYSVARCMVKDFTELLRIEHRLNHNVKISLICPGKVATNYFITNGDGKQEDRVPMLKWIKEIEPETVAEKVVQVIINCESVDAIFPSSVKALVTFAEISPTVMQWMLTHVFGWQPTKAKL